MVVLKGKRNGGFSLIEAFMAMVLIAIAFLATISAISFNQVQLKRDKERALVWDFGVHYLELVKGLPFEEVVAGSPVNALFNGTGAAPNIRIPVNSNWVSISTSDYLLFHPELSELSTRVPQMRVQLDVTQSGGADHTKEIFMEIQWNAPLDQGPRSSLKLNMVRTKDL